MFGLNNNPEPTIISEEEIAKAMSHPVLIDLNTRLAKQVEENAKLIKQIEGMNTNIRTYVATLDRKQIRINNVGDYLKEALDDREIESEVASKIADLLGIGLTTLVEVKMTFEATASVLVPYGSKADVDEVAENFYATLTYGGYGEVDSEHIEMTDWSDYS